MDSRGQVCRATAWRTIDGGLQNYTGVNDQNHALGGKNAGRQSNCWRGFRIAEKKREVQGKGERERYTQLNAEFQRIARRDKKVFLMNNENK